MLAFSASCALSLLLLSPLLHALPQELNNATFKPDLKTPCVCGKGKGLRDSSALETAKHTLFCQNFMRACESLNKNSEVQNMSDKMRRHVSHFAQYDTNRAIRAQQRRQIIQEIEDQELTFSPAVNPNSLKVPPPHTHSNAAHAPLLTRTC